MPSRRPGKKAAEPSSASPPDSSRHTSPAELARTVCLLAQGVQLVFHRVIAGHVIVNQDREVPPVMQLAQSRLGRLRMVEGKEEGEIANLHNLITLCQKPLCDAAWNLDAFANDAFEFRDCVLVDPDFSVPTGDCEEIATAFGGFGDDQIVQAQLFDRLLDLVNGYKGRKDEVYTALRTLFGRQMLIDDAALVNYLGEHDLERLIFPVREAFYETIHPAWLVDGMLHQCPFCGALMKPIDRQSSGSTCPMVQCATTHAATAPICLDPRERQYLVAKPQVLKYWSAPAIDELHIYQVAKDLDIDGAALYPFSDAADIGLGGTAIGIDSKSYASPEMLARTLLRKGLGRFGRFRRHIIAISDYCVSNARGGYLSRLRERLREYPEHPANRFDIMSVSDLVAMMPILKEQIRCMSEKRDA